MFKKFLALAIIVLSIIWSFSSLLPNKISNIDTKDNLFSTDRALIHLKTISKNEHYLGSEGHDNVRTYIISELEKLGLETQIQEGFSKGKTNTISKPKNILTRIKGRETGKALMLLSHYDSQPYSSFGASDAGSGVVTILEGVRAFLSDGKLPKNDIIILLTDSEELDLNGAALFVNHHEWADDVGLVLNFEARGSGGPSIMLMETNQGNAQLMEEFVAANPEFPVANSLAYSIYKMLPNDTDLTRFRADKDIDGFNFAFIDDHFDYHSALDIYERLDRNSLEHQGSYLMPLLHHFSDINLANLKSDEDYIYFNMPIFKTVIYPFSWILPMLIGAVLLFIILIIYGLKKQSIIPKEIGKGFLIFIILLVFSGLIGVYGWKLILAIYPQYNEILHGFTYNGYEYMFAFVSFIVALCFYAYSKVFAIDNTPSLLVAPLTFWILICGLFALKLEGASFFVIPVIFGLLSLFVLIRQKHPNVMLMALFAFPLLTIITPLVKLFPVGLGLKMLVASTILVTLIFGLLLPIFGFFKKKKRLSQILLFIGICFMISAHLNSKFTVENPKPNSLVYILDADTNSASWNTYDKQLDSWTNLIFKKNSNQLTEESSTTFNSKYQSNFTYSKKAEIKSIAEPKIEITFDSIIDEYRHLEICLTSNRNANRIDVYTNSDNSFKSVTVNGVSFDKGEQSSTLDNRLFSYYITDDEPLDLMISMPKNQETTLQFYESSYDLLDHESFNIPKRNKNMIPKPFVLNDAIIIKRSIIIK